MRSIAAVLLIAVCFAADLASDLLIRARGLDGTHGISADAYDITTSIGIGIGALVFVFTTRSES